MKVLGTGISPEEDRVPAPHSWDPSGARARSQAQAEHKICNHGV